jgi:hypothetical protein
MIKKYAVVLMDMLKGKELSHEIVQRERLMTQEKPPEIIDEVAKAFGVGRQAIVKRGVKQVAARKSSGTSPCAVILLIAIIVSGSDMLICDEANLCTHLIIRLYDCMHLIRRAFPFPGRFSNPFI